MMEKNRETKPINSDVTFQDAALHCQAQPDLSRFTQTTGDKLVFAAKAINRWNAFVESVDEIERAIRLYEDRVSIQIGGERDE